MQNGFAFLIKMNFKRDAVAEIHLHLIGEGSIFKRVAVSIGKERVLAFESLIFQCYPMMADGKEIFFRSVLNMINAALRSFARFVIALFWE